MQRISEALDFIEQVTNKCDEVQNNVLLEILNQNAEVQYLKRHGISKDCMDRKTFKTKVPIITYDDIKSVLQRFANGDFTPVLCATPFSEFYCSSGTSEGQPKLIPATDDAMKRRHMLYTLPTCIISKYIEGLDKGKALRFLFTWNGTQTAGGLKVRPVLSCYYTSEYYRESLSDPFNMITSPLEAIHCQDHFQSIYTQMLCGLYQRNDVVCIGATFASGIIEAINFLKRHYLELSHDITSGELNPKITDFELRARMLKMFVRKPEPKLGEFVNQACKGENWEGVIRKIWPNVKYLDTIFSGFATQYIPQMDYYSGNMPKVSPRYSSSKCAFGVNLNPLCDPSEISYTLMPNMAYFEFIPLDSTGTIIASSDTQPEPVELANVEVGKEYELVVTTYTGLYRYKMGDVLSPTGFYNKAPQFKYVRRNDVVLSIYADNTTESELQNAVNNALIVLQTLNTSLVEYTSYVDVKTSPAHYVIYWELSKDLTDGSAREVIEKCCLEMEETLGLYYRLGRVHATPHGKWIGPLEIRVVRNGTFDKLRKFATSNASVCQYKVPRCLKSMAMVDLMEAMVDLMEAMVLSTYFSPSPPHCPANLSVE